MMPRRGARLTRRTFFQVGAAFGAAGFVRPNRALAAGPRIAACLPLPFAHTRFSDIQSLLSAPLAAFDLLLLPAYAAAGLIARRALLPLGGPAGRAHDPDGAFSIPHSYHVAALLGARQAPASLDDLWQAASQTLWPSDARLLIGAALQRRGYSPNDTHPGHLAQVQADLAARKPRLARDPAAALSARQGRLAYALLPVGAIPDLTLPIEGSPLVEFDWVIPAGANAADAALVFLQNLQPPELSALPDFGRRLIPLAPLPPAARAQHAEIWAELTRASRHRPR